MSQQGIEYAGMYIVRELISIAREVMDDDRVGINVKVGQNTLADSQLKEQIEGIVKARGDVVITLLFNHYIDYIIAGRAPKVGKPPPIDVLKDWAERKGIPTDAPTLYAISYAIWRDGYAGRPIFEALDRKIDAAWASGFSDRLFEGLLEDVDKFFNT